MTATTPLLIGSLGGVELLVVLAVLVLLFGASKLPELARGTGQALRILKDETKGLTGSDDTAPTTAASVPTTASTSAPDESAVHADRERG